VVLAASVGTLILIWFFVKAASVGGLFHLSDAIISVVGTKLPIWDVVATVATGGNPDMTRAAQFSRE
jgi:hypothetical protein